MYRSKVCVQEFSYFVSGLDIQLEKSEYYSPVRKKIGCRWQNTTSLIQFYSGNWYEPMAQWLLLVKTGCRESGDMGSIPEECWNALQRLLRCLGHFAWHWASQCTDTSPFYIAVLSIFSSWILSVEISRWQSCKSWHNHVTSTVLENLNLGQGQHSPTFLRLMPQAASQ